MHSHDKLLYPPTVADTRICDLQNLPVPPSCHVVVQRMNTEAVRKALATAEESDLRLQGLSFDKTN